MKTKGYVLHFRFMKSATELVIQYMAAKDMNKSRLARLLNDSPQNYYLANRLPAPVGRDYFLKKHAKHLKRLGFSCKYSFYSWKHSGAVMAVRAGINLKDLQLQMRHHSLDQLNEYLKAMGVLDSADLRARFPGIG